MSGVEMWGDIVEDLFQGENASYEAGNKI